MLSCLVRFPSCGLLWTVDVIGLSEVQAVDLDKAPPDFTMNVLGVIDGRGAPVHPRYLAPLLENGTATKEVVRAACLEEIVRGCRRILQGEPGEVQVTPDLVRNPQEALDAWLPMNRATKG